MSYLHYQAIADLAISELPKEQHPMISDFLQSYYALASDNDLEEYTAKSLFATAHQHFKDVLQYDGETDIISVFTPDQKTHGYDSDCSVIDIVTRDRPFLIDSIQMAFLQENIAIRFITHPIYHIKFTDGKPQHLSCATHSDQENTSLVHIEFDRLPTARLKSIKDKIATTLRAISMATEDWKAMNNQVFEVIKDIQNTRNIPQTIEESVETIKFLEWLQNSHFTFLGYREYDLRDKELYIVANSGLGVLRDNGKDRPSGSFAMLTPALQNKVLDAELLTFSKSRKMSEIHRPVYMDCIGIKKFDDAGNVIGKHQFLGLLTAEVYRAIPQDIPLIANKVSQIAQSVDLPLNSHAAKSLNHVLEQLPRDELFQSNTDQIKEMALTVFHMQERDILRFFARKDVFETFVMCYIYVPKDRYSTKLRMAFESYLMKAFDGYASDFSTHFSESLHVRVNIVIRTNPNMIPEFDSRAIEADLTPMMLNWQDETAAELRSIKGKSKGNQLLRRFERMIPLSYKDKFSPREGAYDLQVLNTLNADSLPLELKLYRDNTCKNNNELRLKIYGVGDLTALSDVLPVLENFGFAVRSATPYKFMHTDGSDTPESLWLVSFKLILQHELSKSLDDISPCFIEAFKRTWTGLDESDGFDRLTISEGISPRDITILRAVSKYMVQAKAPYSNYYMQQAINNNASITVLLLKLFHARMGLNVSKRDQQVAALQATIEEQLSAVSSLAEDRILRWFMTVINALVRTNFYQKDSDGNHKSYLSFKIESAKIPDLPLPKPLYEIFVFSSDVEAIHLRGGKVARGGLRWSDRVEDFRTEVLGLVKAQIVKNSVIVPVGSKGGFIVKKPDNSSREAFVNEGIKCYKTFMRGMLDITDNIVSGEIVPPQDVYRHDQDDPYLVVAADKGTATFSDIANSMAAEYGFWLGDAFASGGSVGYDHKGMGITARGAWESVKRHFRHLGKDIQNEEFTIIGIGDMGGDVFGNGMLLSEKIQLTAAFNHLHIFIDPTPDAAATFAERKRLFETPRTTWDDFNKELISKGGGVFARSEKSITITPEMKATFAISEDKLSPNQLIKHLLMAPVELLWNGGIGTYVKAENETHEQVGDKANDVLRINGSELRCKVIGEGGNLGMTQLGRIEFAKNNGMILTDAIDNSAGVNCSDHEVNIKILLNQQVESGQMSVEERNKLLESMTEEVGNLVLRQNYQQPQAISIGVSNRSLFIDHIRIIRKLEKSGRLNRELEYLPSEKELKQRLENGQGLYAPEIAVMMAYSKIHLFEEIVDSDLPESGIFQSELAMYFPSALRKDFRDNMQAHRLRREIIATFVTNSIVNHMGSVFIHRTKEATGQSSPQIVLAYCASRNILSARNYWGKIDALDNKVCADLQNSLHLRIRRTLEQFSNWFLHNRRDCIDIEALNAEFKDVFSIAKLLPTLLEAKTVESCESAIAGLVEQGVPHDLAHDLVYMQHLDSALDIITLSKRSGSSIEATAQLYFSIANTLNARWLMRNIELMYGKDYWQRRACYSLAASLKNTIVAVTEQALTLDSSPEKALDTWQNKYASRLASYQACLAEILQDDPSLPRLSVAIGEMSSLTSNS